MQLHYSLNDRNFEIIVVDDCSEDNSIDIKKFPSKLIQVEKHSAPSKARNVGAENSRGDILFFTGANCRLPKDGLSIVRKPLSGCGADMVLGGEHTPIPYDKGFFSAVTFKKLGGFSENVLPLREDVELSQWLRRADYKLLMIPISSLVLKRSSTPKIRTAWIG